MSKFAKPGRAGGEPTAAEIDRIIGGADAVDDRRADNPAPDGGEVRFTMTLDAELGARVDRARKRAGGLSRLAWLRLAAAEKLERDGA